MKSIIRGNVLWLGLVSLLNDVSTEMVFPLLPLFVTHVLLAGPGALGVIEGVAEATSGLAKLAGGWLSDRAGRRKHLALAGYLLAAAARPFFSVAVAVWQVVAVRFVDRIGKGLRTAPRDALLAESVPESQRGAAFGFHRGADHAGAVIGPLLATAFLAWRPGDYRTLFAIAAVPGLLAVLTMALRVRDVPPPPEAAHPRASTVATAVASGALGSPFRRFLAVVVLFTLGNATDAFLLLRAEGLGVDPFLLPLMWSVLHVSKAAWSVPGGMLADRFGSRGAIIAGWILYAAVYAGFAYATQTWHAWALVVVYGLFYGLTESPERALVAKLAPPERRGLAFGAYHLAMGLALLPASLLFGFLWQAFDHRAAFLTGAALALAAAAALPLLLPHDGPALRPPPPPT